MVPPQEILEKATAIKLLIRDEFGIKYALKSPPHVTLKMPFSYNEAKESFLEEKLSVFLRTQRPFEVKIKGVGTFGKRVIFLGIEKSSELVQLQSSLTTFCKKELHLVAELSDSNYHPHLTIAFKDLKVGQFDNVFNLVKSRGFQAEYFAEGIHVLKRLEQKWIVHKKITLGG